MLVNFSNISCCLFCFAFLGASVQSRRGENLYQSVAIEIICALISSTWSTFVNFK